VVVLSLQPSPLFYDLISVSDHRPLIL
jgi:hypothetical protein